MLLNDYFDNPIEVSYSEYKLLFDAEYTEMIHNNVLYSFKFSDHSDNLRALNVFIRKPELNTLVFRNDNYNHTFIKVGKNQILSIFKFIK